MATTDISNITGFVLREFKYKESSKIIDVFTQELGKISIMAKGVLKGKNTNLSSTQRFVKANFNLYKSSNDFYGIKEASLIQSYSKSNKSFDIILYKVAICDLLLRTIDQTQNEIVFNLLDSSFEAFEKSSKNRINIFLAFLLKYISFSGFKPNLGFCGSCGKKIEGKDIYFSKELSSVVCQDCKLKVKDKIYLTKDEFIYLKKLLYTSSREVEEISEKIDVEKIGTLIINFCLENLEIKKFNSIDWIFKSIGHRS